jgi:hypothetical protein
MGDDSARVAGDRSAVDEQHLRRAEAHPDVARARARLDRRLAEEALVARLARTGFEGPGWEEVLAPELARYGEPVLTVWIMSGMIFVRCREKQLRLPPWKRSLTREEAGDLARMTVAHTLPTFRERALVKGGWRPDGGASLASWFIGSCLYAFPNLWRAWRSEQTRWDDAHGPAVLLENNRPPVCDPAAQVAGQAEVLATLAGMGEVDGKIFALAVDGYTQPEIAEILGLTVRAVEGRVRRVRLRHQQREG